MRKSKSNLQPKVNKKTEEEKLEEFFNSDPALTSHRNKFFATESPAETAIYYMTQLQKLRKGLRGILNAI